MLPDRWLWPGSLLLLVFFTCRAQAERDPFQPPPAFRCLSLPPAAPVWQLRGIVGRAEDYRAWLISSQGKGKLWGQQQWPDERWQLLKVDPLGITVVSALTCQAPLRITLKGNIYARDVSRASGQQQAMPAKRRDRGVVAYGRNHTKAADAAAEAMGRQTFPVAQSADHIRQPGGTASLSAASRSGATVSGVR